ncbi:uncharacterized protein TNCV_1935291 [Trichonephila clavipes]|nr:uncharacterized protein TNCV_1935291 [Trichonephila clavipes]
MLSSRFPPPTTLIELETALQEKWRLLNSAMVDHPIESMVRRSYWNGLHALGSLHGEYFLRTSPRNTLAVSGNGIFIKNGNRSVRAILTILRSFRTELLAIEALKFCFTESVNTDIWKLSDSQSSIQPLAEWWRHGDRTTTSIVQILNCLSVNVKIFFQWVPSHVNVCGIEIADALAREDSHKDSTHSGCLTSEIYNWLKQDISFTWRQAPVHEWYEGNRPGASLLGTSRRDEMIFARLRSGHTLAQRHMADLKVYPSCPNCNVTQVARSCLWIT